MSSQLGLFTSPAPASETPERVRCGCGHLLHLHATARRGVLRWPVPLSFGCEEKGEAFRLLDHTGQVVHRCRKWPKDARLVPETTP